MSIPASNPGPTVTDHPLVHQLVRLTGRAWAVAARTRRGVARVIARV